jgi:hypothetical protein
MQSVQTGNGYGEVKFFMYLKTTPWKRIEGVYEKLHTWGSYFHALPH